MTLIELASRVTLLHNVAPGRWAGLCPFHEEKTPSFEVRTLRKEGETFSCYGCGVSGAAADFAQLLKERGK